MTTPINDGGPAFPHDAIEDPDAEGCFYGGYPGMTLRDYFAAKANEDDTNYHIWKGFKEDYVFENQDGTKSIKQRQAMWPREEAKYRYADAMIKARGAA